jgi:hypothetical protein
VAELSIGNSEASFEFMSSCRLGQTVRRRGLEGTLRSIFGNSNHLWMWDEISLARELKEAGFADVRRCKYRDSIDPMFARVEEYSKFVDINYVPEIVELAMEARARS